LENSKDIDISNINIFIYTINFFPFRFEAFIQHTFTIAHCFIFCATYFSSFPWGGNLLVHIPCNHVACHGFMGVAISQKFYKLVCNQKKRVRRHPTHWLPSTNPGIHVFLIYSTHIRRPKTPSNLSSYWCFQALQSRKHTDALLSRDNSTDSTAYISCLSNSYRCQQGRLSYCIYRLCTSYESTNSAFHRMFTKKKTQIHSAVYSLIPL
jgi:hypothetical protein